MRGVCFTISYLSYSRYSSKEGIAFNLIGGYYEFIISSSKNASARDIINGLDWNYKCFV